MENAATEQWGTDDAPTEAYVADHLHPPQPSDRPGATDDAGAFVGSVINDRYLVRGVLGHGATADVYRAHDQQLERDVAIKILTPQLSGQPEAAARFQDEGLVTARVHHPNVAAVFDTGLHDHRPFIVMECLSGGTLADRISRGALAAEEVHDIARQLLAALHAAHAVGVVHRDVKPSNILLSSEGVAKLADFGIAKDDARADHTAVGLVVGTPSYMAPERLRGSPATANSDLYALGMVLHDARRGPRSAVATTRSADAPHELDAADPSLASVVARATQADPELRFASAADMLAALEHPHADAGTPSRSTASERPRFFSTQLVKTPRQQLVAAFVAVIIVIIGAAFVIAATSDDATPPASGPTTTIDPLPATLRTAITELREAVGS